MPRKSRSKAKTAQAQSQQIINTVLQGINLPSPGQQIEDPGPKMETCTVGPFRLPGVKVHLDRYTDLEHQEMRAWVSANHGYGADSEAAVFSWRSEKLRDWFILRWS